MPKYTLVDWYGNRQTFDRDTIYAEGEDGGLVPFTHGTGNPVIEPLNVTKNGTYEVPDGVNGYSPVSVNVPAPEIKLQEKTITENGEYTADAGFDGLAKVLVNVAGSGGTLVGKSGTFTGNGSKMTITHGLGTVPAVIVCYPKGGLVTTTAVDKAIRGVCGCSSAVGALVGLSYTPQIGAYWDKTANQYKPIADSYFIDETRGDLANANEITFDIGSRYATNNGSNYEWYAIGIKK